MVFNDVALKSSTFIFEFPTSKAKVQSFTPTDPHPRVVFLGLSLASTTQASKRGTQTKGQAIETTKYLINPC